MGKLSDFKKDMKKGLPFEGCVVREADGTSRPLTVEEKEQIGIKSVDLSRVKFSEKGYKLYGNEGSPIRVFFKK